MFIDTFYSITMKTKNNKKLYLKEGKGNSLEWTFNRDECIWFELEQQAINCAKNYFKNFNNWFIEEFEYHIN